MKFIEMIKQYGRCTGMCKNLFPPVICKDGTFMSCQASEYHHCYPQENVINFDEYESFEVRTDLKDNLLSPYIADGENMFDFVDAVVIDTIIEKHGGLDIEAIERAIKE